MDQRLPSPRSRPPARPRRFSLNDSIDAIGGVSPVVRSSTREVSTQASRRHASTDTSDPRSASQPSHQAPLPNMDAYSTLSPGYFTNLLNRDSDDVLVFGENMDTENEVMESPTLNDLNSQPKPKGCSKNFNEAEDILLISAYLNINKDDVVGRDQKDGRFWERVEKYYHENKTFESDRNWSSLKHRWSSTIHKEVTLFQGFLAAVERKNESGKTMSDKLATAKELKGKAFSLFHAWNLLKNEPKWAEDKGPKEDNVEGHSNLERPLGRKAEKEKVKGRKRDDDEPDPFIEEVKKMRESREQIEREWKERDDRFMELDKKKLDLEQDQHDKMIMTTYTSTMDEHAQKYFRLMKEEILSRRFGRQP